MFRASGNRRLKAAEPHQRCLDRLFERSMRLCSKNAFQVSVVHVYWNAPEIAHLEHLTKRSDERRRQYDEPPRELSYCRLGACTPFDYSLDGSDHLGSIGVPVPFQVESREGLERVAPRQQSDYRASDVGKVSPLMAYAA